MDSRRDITAYQSMVAANGMRIVAVNETHIHADFLSGHVSWLPRLVPPPTSSARVGRIGSMNSTPYACVRTTRSSWATSPSRLFTLRHTPEHLSFLITDHAFADTAGYMLSDDLGRHDLLDDSTGAVGTLFGGANQLFTSLREKFLTLPDHI